MKIKLFNLVAALLAVFAVLIMGCPTPGGGGGGNGNNNETPTADDFEISGTGTLLYEQGKVKTVTITPKSGKSKGIITVKYDGSTTAPSELGIYAVTFDVAEAPGWNAAADLDAGTLEIAEQTANPQLPTADDFDIGNLSQTVGKVTAVTITPKQGKSNGAITIYYNGGASLPKERGAYPVTFDVKEAVGWKPAAGLAAGTLTISDVVISSISNLSKFLSDQKANTVNTPYYIALNIKEAEFESLQKTLNGAPNKYVNLNFSGNTITNIPDCAFNSGAPSYTGCPTLTGVTIPDSVTSIKSGAFSGCSSLTGVNIPSGVTSIGVLAFHGCISFTSVTIPYSVTSIEEKAFYLCNSLASVAIIGEINSNNFSEKDVFPGDLRTKYYAINPTKGTPGIYRTANPGENAVWTLIK